MAFPTAVNSQITDAVASTTVNGQITDAVTQTNVHVLGNAPAMAMSNLYQATSQALSNAAQNASSHQQALHTLGHSVAARCASVLLGRSSDS
jgi:hypothetical protein